MFKYGIDHLTVSQALAIAQGQLEGVICDEAKTKIERVHNEVVAVAQGDKAVYGINTGFGPLCDTVVSKEKTTQLQRNLLLSHSVGVGQPIKPTIAKLMLILKAHALSQGFSGLSMEIIERILWHINNDIIPVVPEQGSVGASGDLAPLSHLFLPLIGEGQVFFNGKITATAEVFKELNIAPVHLHPKSVLGLINGTQFIASHAIMVVDKLHNCLSHADIIAALMLEGLDGLPSPFLPELHDTRPFKGNQHVASRIHALLDGSEIITQDKVRVQDPYSLRCSPQVHGASRNAWLHFKEMVEIEINSVTDNPIVFSKDHTVSGGNFHGQPLALPLDYACLAAAELGSISDRRTYLSLEGKYGKPPRLLMDNTGVNSGFMILQYTSAALVSENKGLCFPSSADSVPTSLGQEDHVSMGSIGGRKALRVCENLEKILAVELLCAAQALDFNRPLQSSNTLEEIHQQLRQKVSFATEDRIFAKDIEQATELIQSRKLVAISTRNGILDNSRHPQLFDVY